MRNTFPHISDANIDAGIIDGPQIRELIRDMDFDLCMNPDEIRAWNSLKLIIIKFIVNHRSAEYEIVVHELMVNYRHL